jgi:glycosyltransferase involved in cell wall biosynthesis
MKSMNAGICVTYVPPTYIGGGETYIYYLSRELAKLGVDIRIFTTPTPRTAEWDWSHARFYESKSIFDVRNTPVMPSLLFNMIRYGRYDVIHTAVPQGFACDVSAIASRVLRKPLVVMYHCDLIPLVGILRAYSLLLRLFTFRLASKIIVSTRSYAETSPLLSSFMEKIAIVPLGADLSHFSYDEQYRQEIRRKHGIVEDERVVLFVGGLNYYHRFKRVDLLVRAMADVCDDNDSICLIVVGQGEIKSELEKLAHNLNLHKAIFTGYVSNEDLPKYYCAADLFVLPSLTREEAFGIVLVEAAACGAIPLTFDIPGPGEVCRDMGGCVCPVEPDRPPSDSLSKAIAEMLKSDLNSRRTECQKKAKNYSWAASAKKTLEIYNELV